MEIPSDGFFSQFMGTDVQKRACGLRCHLLPGILAVESAENRTGDYLQFPLWGYADCAASYGTALALRRDSRSQTTVRAPSIVVANPFRQEPTEMLFVERDHEIQTLASHGPDQSFTKCIPLRLLRRSFQHLHTEIVH
jgi:hypothetical protein